MAYNLFIAYDLMKPGQNYEAVIEQIRSLGPCYQFQYSLFYVNTPKDPHAAAAHVALALDANDRLAVINASGGVVTTWDKPPISEINSIWSVP